MNSLLVGLVLVCYIPELKDVKRVRILESTKCKSTYLEVETFWEKQPYKVREENCRVVEQK